MDPRGWLSERGTPIDPRLHRRALQKAIDRAPVGVKDQVVKCCDDALRLELRVALQNQKVRLESRSAEAPFDGNFLSAERPSSHI